MTSKQIIDDVDVSECEWIREVGLDSEYICTCNSPNKTSGYCKYNSNCRYKQLKRKEKECEELKNDKFALEVHIDSLTSPVNVEDCEHSVYNGEYIACRYYEGQRCDELDFSNCMFRENVRLKKQLNQLKVENDALKKSILQECPNCGEEYLNYKGVELYDENEKYKQALQEIKEIANSDNHYFSDGTILRYEVVNKILQKISEVVDEKI